MIENSSEKYLQLSREEKLKALSSQILGLLSEQEDRPMGVPLHRVQSMFTRKYGRPLIPLQYGCQDIEDLVKTIPHAVQVCACKVNRIIFFLTNFYLPAEECFKLSALFPFFTLLSNLCFHVSISWFVQTYFLSF